MKQDFSIHPVTADDLPEVAEMHVRVWQQAYPGQMPQAFLDGLDPVARLEGWRSGFEKNKDDSRYGVLLARVAGKGAGFLSYGPARDDDRSGWSEVYGINILQQYWAQGVGHALFTEACRLLKARGERRTYLWVLNTNQNALNAYRRWGGTVEEGRTKRITIGGAALLETSVFFDIA